MNQIKHKRLVALDVLRGLTIALMIIVNNPGSWRHVYAPLLHSKWHGWTPTDLVFPFFLFIVGTAMWYSFKKFNHKLDKALTKKILKRTFLIFLVGVLLTTFPYYNQNISTIRIMNVLQRIALAYGIAAFIAMLLKPKKVFIVSILILFAYWGILYLFGGDTPLTLEGNAVRKLDLFLLGEKHLYTGYGIPFDPEGLLSTLPAIVNVLFGFLIGRIIDINSNKLTAIKKIFIYGVVFTAIGLIWDQFFPINKPIWTSSYVFLTCGLATILLSFLLWIIDIKGYKKWAHPFVVYGMNPLFIYVLAGVWARLLGLIKVTHNGTAISLKGYIYNELLASWLSPLNASLVFALHLGVLFWLIAWWLYNKKIFIKL